MSKISSQNNVSELLNEIAKQLEPEYEHKEIALQAAWSLLINITGKTRAELIALFDILLTQQQIDQIEEWIEAISKEHKPIQYVLGAVFFLDLKIVVRPPILIPRPETEDWCHALISHLAQRVNEPLRILDLCTGSGCIALAMAHAFKKGHVTAIDISPEACALTRENAKLNNITNIDVIESDLFEKLSKNHDFDLIVSNPPYIAPDVFHTLDPSVREWEDRQALIAEDEGLSCIKKIIAQAPAFLDNHSSIKELWIEISPEQERAIVAEMENAGFAPISTHLDLTRQARAVSGQLKNKIESIITNPSS